MDDYVEPVVKERPMRGREMRTNIIPTDVFDTMKYVSAKKTLRNKSLVPELEAPSSKKAELYHEGYVDGKLYLVPDSNLEAMRDMIKFKFKPRRSSRYRHQTSFELTDYDHFRGKLHNLIEKIEEIESESEEEVEEMEEETVEEEEEEKKEEEKAEEEEKLEEEKLEEEEKAEEEEKVEPLPKPVEPLPKQIDPNHLRFLISGHFQKGKKPIYIIQDYRGGPDLFRDQKADFYTKQREDNVDLTISGRFYDKQILEESQGKPKALNIKPYKILIDEKSSNVYDKYFEQVYKFSSVDITLRGEFIKSKITERITPFLTLDIKEKHPAEPNIRSEREDNYNRRPSTTVLVYKPDNQFQYGNPFAKGDENVYAYSVVDNQVINSNALVLQSTIAVLSPNFKNNNEQTSSNCTEGSNVEDEIYQRIEDNECNLKTIVSVKPYDIDRITNTADDNDINIEKYKYTEERVINKSTDVSIYKPPYSKDLEHLENTRYSEKKMKKKRNSHIKGKSISTPRTTASVSSPILQKDKIKGK